MNQKSNAGLTPLFQKRSLVCQVVFDSCASSLPRFSFGQPCYRIIEESRKKIACLFQKRHQLFCLAEVRNKDWVTSQQVQSRVPFPVSLSALLPLHELGLLGKNIHT